MSTVFFLVMNEVVVIKYLMNAGMVSGGFVAFGSEREDVMSDEFCSWKVYWVMVVSDEDVWCETNGDGRFLSSGKCMVWADIQVDGNE